MNDWDALLSILTKIPNKHINIDEDCMTIEIFDYDRGTIVFLFNNDKKLIDWE